MQINQIEPKFKELEKGVDGAMQQIGDLEKRLEQLAHAHNTRLESLEETEHSHEEESRESEIPPIEEAAIPLNIGEEASELVVNAHRAAEETSEAAEEIGVKVATEVGDAMFPVPEPEPEPETVASTTTLKVDIQGDVNDPEVQELIEHLRSIVKGDVEIQ